ncbi:hypothetical protein ABZ341_18040 [Streptomyces sp. NPDC006173]|uniref:hypothetical protein n=1 Tax=Streptomyces sp. NPDC006173 TaxID=3155349 RepID=UPI0033DB8417
MRERSENDKLDLTAYRAALAGFQQIAASNAADALLNTSSDGEHRRVLAFARELEEAGLSIDDRINGHVLYQRDGDPDWARKSPTAREEACPSVSPFGPDPWATPTPKLADVTAVVAGHLAEALLDGKSDELRTFARSLAYELKRIGCDLDDAIEQRVQQLAPGTPPVKASEQPF